MRKIITQGRSLATAAALAVLALGCSEAHAQIQIAQVQVGQATRGSEQACKPDVEKFCAGVERGGGRILQCLKSHSSDLAPDCKTALDAAAERLKSRRGQSTN